MVTLGIAMKQTIVLAKLETRRVRPLAPWAVHLASAALLFMQRETKNVVLWSPLQIGHIHVLSFVIPLTFADSYRSTLSSHYKYKFVCGNWH